METTWKPQVSKRETWGKPPGNPGFLHGNQGKLHGNLKFPQGKHKGNHMETPQFPPRFPDVGNYCAPVSRIPWCGNHKETSGFLQGNQWETAWKLQVSYKKISGKRHGNIRFPICFPMIGNYCIPVSRLPLLGNLVLNTNPVTHTKAITFLLFLI